jgi:Cu2+-exporting ATPase
VGRVVSCNGLNEEQVLAYAAAVECQQEHPIAQAIVENAQTAGLALPEIDACSYQVGYGVTARSNGSVVQVGSARFMRSEGVEGWEGMQAVADETEAAGHSLVIVALDGQIRGGIEVCSQARPGARQMIGHLRRHGIQRLAVVSGDGQQPTQQLARSLGIEKSFYGVLPEAKAELVTRLQAEGRSVCFVGDGINDALAMQQADVSVSLSGATTVATNVAQVVLMNGRLEQMCDLFDLSASLEANLGRSYAIMLASTIANLGGLLLIPGYSVLSAIGVKNVGSLLGMANASWPLLAGWNQR